MSFGFLGVQIGYSLQNANTSRVLQSLDADVEHLSYFWLAAPVAGLIVQPIVGLFSDRTWTRFGRRIPFILGGALLAGLALFLMPNAEMFVNIMPALFFAGIMLLFMDMAFNVTMQPFRALVADMVNDKQRTKGYAVQTFLVNVGAVVGSVLPFVLVHFFGMSNASTPEAKIPQSVAWAYYIGGAILIGTVLVTAFMTKEYPPKDYNRYNNAGTAPARPKFKELITGIPKVMWQLAVVQFFSWFSLFLLWTYTTPAVAQNVWRTTDTSSLEYNEAGDWVGIIFATYSVFSALFSLVIVWLSNRIGNKGVYSVSLLLGGLGFIGMMMCTDKYALLVPMVGLGVAWAAILAMPYTILSKSIKADRMGVYMGIFNFTIVIPQIISGIIGGTIVKYVFDSNATGMIYLAGFSLLAAAASVFIVKEKQY
ncbi:Predicted maltose transporter MalT [Mucinivorans hirudinis]|uniref:Predicted maltose transporter MalT n=1 Tax=Mucinivorans hirudinis TaxID=1433126 RepID=A0A060R962_9BACT|nr:Predicted maltose transporter MalT [Mucinivorans hirudinis]